MTLHWSIIHPFPLKKWRSSYPGNKSNGDNLIKNITINPGNSFYPNITDGMDTNPQYKSVDISNLDDSSGFDLELELDNTNSGINDLKEISLDSIPPQNSITSIASNDSIINDVCHF